MKQQKFNIGLLVAALLSVTTLAIAPVSAQHGSDDTVAAQTTTTTTPTTTTSTSGSTTSGRHSSTETEHATEVETETETEVHKGSDDAARVKELRAEAQTKVQELRAGKTEKTAAQRQKLCENRKTAAGNKIKAFSQSADKHLTRLNDVYTKLQAYQTTNNVTVANWAALKADADAKGAAATQAVTALDTVTVNGIDCTSTDPASSLTVVKTAAKDARDALKAYRTSLKNIVVALAQAKTTTSTDDSTTNSTNTTTTTDTTNTTSTGSDN